MAELPPLPPGFVLDDGAAGHPPLPPGFVVESDKYGRRSFPDPIPKGAAILGGDWQGDEAVGVDLANEMRPAFLRKQDPGQLAAGVLGAISGATFGFAPRLKAGARAALGLGDYEKELAAANLAMEAAQFNNPGTFLAGNVAGAIASPVSKIGAAAKTAGTLGRVVGGARQGAIGGGLFGASQSEDLGDVGDVATNSATGALVGGGAGAVLGRVIGGKPAARVGPTGAEVAAAGREIGVDVPLAAATDSRALQGAAAVSKQAPFGGSLVNAGERSADQLNKAIGKTSADYGRGVAATAAEAGDAAKTGFQQYTGTILKGRENQLYGEVDKLVNPAVTSPLVSTAQTATRIMAERGNAALPESGAVKQVMDALSRPGGLNYAGIKTLRTSIGQQLENPSLLTADIPAAELKRLYGALTIDLKQAVQAAGGVRARQAFDAASSFAQAAAKRREALNGLLGSKSDEGVFSAILQKAGSTGTADIKLLAQARKSLSPDEWDKVASASIARLGAETTENGAQVFSPAKFATAYGNLTPAGKAILFDSKGRPELRAALDNIATVSARFKQINSLRNTSNSAVHGAWLTTAAGILTAPIPTVTALLGNATVAAILSKPATARAMAGWSRAYEVAARTTTKSTLAALKASSQRFASTIGKELGLDAHVAQMSRALADAVTNPPQNGDGDQQPDGLVQ